MDDAQVHELKRTYRNVFGAERLIELLSTAEGRKDRKVEMSGSALHAFWLKGILTGRQEADSMNLLDILEKIRPRWSHLDRMQREHIRTVITVILSAYDTAPKPQVSPIAEGKFVVFGTRPRTVH